jgi:hypothetical protein
MPPSLPLLPLGMSEGRGWSADGLPCSTADAEDGVAMGFGDKRFQRGVRGRVKEWTDDRSLSDILLQDGRGLLWPKFNDHDSFGVAPTAEGHLARGAGVAHPGHLAIGSDEPALTTGLDQGYRRGVPEATAAAPHGQQRGASRSETHPEKGSYNRIEETAPAA